jgi:hypothetical protein
MLGMLSAEAAVLFVFDSPGLFLLVLGRRIVSIFTNRAF